MMPIMVREPALKAINYLKKMDYQRQENVRMLLYGDLGHGKTQVLTHLVHYLQMLDDHIIIHVNDLSKFTEQASDQEQSITRKGRVNTPLDAALFLQKFRIMNKNRLDRKKELLVTSADYSWSSKESTKKGDTLESIADHGVNRMNHASDCVAVLIKELVLAAGDGRIKLAVVIDDLQMLYTDSSPYMKHADRKRLYIEEITVARALMKLVKSKSLGMVTLAACDDKSERKQNVLPQDCLGDEGWDAMNPCLPIHVPKYSRVEFETYMDHLLDIGWLQRPESATREARNELRFVSGLNPGELFNLCKPL